MALTTNVTAKVTTQISSDLDLQTRSIPGALSLATALTSGTAAGKADLVFMDTRTIAASGTEDLDLAGVLTDALGATLTFATVKVIAIKASASNTNNVVVGNGTNPFVFLGSGAHTVAVKPGGIFLLTAPGTGFTVTASTGDVLKVANSGAGTGVTYDVCIVGTSA